MFNKSTMSRVSLFFRDPRVVFLNINQNWLALERGCMKLGKVLLIRSLSKLAYGMLGQGTFLGVLTGV